MVIILHPEVNSLLESCSAVFFEFSELIVLVTCDDMLFNKLTGAIDFIKCWEMHDDDVLTVWILIISRVWHNIPDC
jgi:hypothetical protein